MLRPRYEHLSASDEKLRPADPAAIAHALGERVKELHCLYELTRLAERHRHSLDDFLADAVELLPPAWQYPETACARITFEGRVYCSVAFEVTAQRQAAALRIDDTTLGEVEVFYRDPRPPAYEGPFLWEERDLIDAVAARIAAIAEYVQIEETLRAERQALTEANVALRALVKAVGERQQPETQAILVNIERVVLPLVDSLEATIDPRHRTWIELLRRHLVQITDPFTEGLGRRFAALTPTELRVCTMIRENRSTKEIADLLHRSPLTVKRHREAIRRKLGLTSAATNLTTFLQSNEHMNMEATTVARDGQAGRS